MPPAMGANMPRPDTANPRTDATEPGPVSRVVSTRRGAAVDPMDLAMHRFADGDDAAFAELFAGLGPRLRGFLRRWTGSADLADDLLQETLGAAGGVRDAALRGAERGRSGPDRGGLVRCAEDPSLPCL